MLTTFGKVALALAVLLTAALGVGLTSQFAFSGGSNEPTPSPTVDVAREFASPTATGQAVVDDLSRAGTPTPTPTPPSCASSIRYSPLPDAQILTYYGNPYTPQMGVLGELALPELIDKLKTHARTYDSLNGPRGVQPALHIVYATAQASAGDNGLYLQYVDEATLSTYLEAACRNGLLVILDLQIGRSTTEAEARKVLKYLRLPYVHLALDPEFAMAEGEVPGETIGSLTAKDVNAAQATLQKLVKERNLPDKVLVVHQFLESMLPDPEQLQDYPNVDLVLNMDGFGGPDSKISKYDYFTPRTEYAGIKLFFKQDTDLLDESRVLGLEPDVIIYQ